jgi:tRNA(adenine34) deaminase
MTRTPEFFMRAALKEAAKAELMDEVPVGAVVVLDNKIIARGHNLREKSQDVSAHAEIVALRKANKKVHSWRLENADIYVTIEPCAMCAGAILWSRIRHVYFGAKEPKGGALVSSTHLYEVSGINHRPEVTGGLLEDECSAIISGYFQKKRKKM